MSSIFVKEVREWNTPIIGAYLLWCFSKGYCEKHPKGASPMVIFHFIASAILTNEMFSQHISGRRPNLESYIRGFNDEKKSDIFVTLQHRIIERRLYTMSSIDIAVATGLLAWDKETVTLHPFIINKKRSKFHISIPMKKLGKKSEILGGWFSCHSVSSLTTYLGITL